MSGCQFLFTGKKSKATSEEVGYPSYGDYRYFPRIKRHTIKRVSFFQHFCSQMWRGSQEPTSRERKGRFPREKLSSHDDPKAVCTEGPNNGGAMAGSPHEASASMITDGPLAGKYAFQCRRGPRFLYPRA